MKEPQHVSLRARHTVYKRIRLKLPSDVRIVGFRNYANDAKKI
jgi:hypothetical protein